jgi:hypothetical protein
LTSPEGVSWARDLAGTIVMLAAARAIVANESQT